MVCLDKLYAISDLHMGGSAGTMMFRESDALAWLIGEATRDSPTENVGLLINGDIFDFLAEDDAQEFRPDADVVIRRQSNGELRPVFEALKNFVATDNRRLILQLGNHDIELALPNVKDALVDVLGATTDKHRARIEFETSGEGWFGVVGGRLLQAIHGNVCDRWNKVDHAGLAKAVEAQGSKMNPVVPPRTNAGTMLVVQGINALKKTFPFVDLLKPEGAPLIAVMNAVNAKFTGTVLFKCAGRLERRPGSVVELLGTRANPPAETADPAEEIENFLASSATVVSSESLLLTAEEDLLDEVTPRELAGRERGRLRMGSDWVSAKSYEITARAIAQFRSEPERADLRKALQSWLADDKTFDPKFLSPIDKCIAAEAAPAVEVLIAGHTHSARERTLKRVTYLNTGSWMRVLKLQSSEYLEDDAKFQRLWSALSNPDNPGPRRTQQQKLEELDQLDLDIRKRPVAVIDRNSVSLRSVSAAGPTYQLVPYGDMS